MSVRRPWWHRWTVNRSLWQHRDFLKLWTGQTLSLFGSQITILAIPLLIAFKYGKPRRYLVDFLEWHTKPRIYCGIERDSQQKMMYLKEDQPECL